MNSAAISNKAIKQLRKDPVMEKLIEMYELSGWNFERDLFMDLIDSIIGQQLSVKAGDTIVSRFKALFHNEVKAEEVLKIPDQHLRNIGISYGKISYIKGVCQAVIDRKIVFENLRELPDEEVISELIQLKGIGRWTAEMFLMFSFGREDVFSLGDLGLRNAVSRLYHVERNDLNAIEQISLKWKPYRSLASRYLWKSLDNEPKG